MHQDIGTGVHHAPDVLKAVMAGADVTLSSTHAEAFITEPAPLDLHNTIELADFYERIHGRDQAVAVGFSPDPHGALIVTEAVARTGELHQRSSSWGLPGMAAELVQLYPALAGVRALRTWAIPTAFTPDDEPIVGKRLKPALAKHGFDVEVFESPTEALKTLLAQLALFGISLDICEHFTPRDAYRLLLEEICPGETAYPELRNTQWVQHFMTSEFCPACEAEFDREYEQRERQRKEHPGDDPDEDLPF